MLPDKNQLPMGRSLEVMPGIGHFPQLEDPQWISERLIGWVRQHSV
jgi:pimeloyl-ACP methyl ester carboxylesterase